MKRAARICTDQLFQFRAAFKQWLVSEIHPVEVEQIEGVEDEASGTPAHCAFQRLKIRDSPRVLNDYLTVENGGADLQLRG
jgi:hypothetical protein